MINKKLEYVELTQHEWNQSTRKNIYKNRKKYDRNRIKKDYKTINPEFD